jgi:hypothetical protein
MFESRLILRTALVLLVLAVSCSSVSAATESDELFGKLAGTPSDPALLARLKDTATTITNANDKARLLVVYCLGCLCAGQNKEATRANDYLRKNYPHQPALKYLSEEYLAETCTNCQGTGYVELACAKCGGSGACSLCKGSGTMVISHVAKPDETVKCAPCKGTGKCRDCGGKGTMQVRCGRCGGKGSSISIDRATKTYMSLLKGEEPSGR